MLTSCYPTWEVHEAINGIQAVILASRMQPDLVLMDYSMPKLNGYRAACHLMKLIPQIKIIMISGFISSENINLLLGAGIQGIVSKSSGTEEILEAIHHVMNGQPHLTVDSSINVPDDEVTPRQPVADPEETNPGYLTQRELEVMKLIVKGNSPEMIIQDLAISRRTLNVHKANIFKKCNLHSVSELLRYAYKNNIL